MKKIFLTLVVPVVLALGCAGPDKEYVHLDAEYYASIPGCCEDVVVSKDGSGDFTTVQEALNSLRTFKPEGRARVFIKKGVYEEKITVPSHKMDISIIGEDRDSTIIIWHDHANMLSGNLEEPMGTFRTWTMRVEGDGLICCNLTIVNDAMSHYNPLWWQDRKDNAGIGQAVALHVEGDREVFANCRFLGFQDTIYTGNPQGRELFIDCYVEGTVDFIFGPATCWFENCDIRAIARGYYTAASTPERSPIGYVFNKCRFSADEAVPEGKQLLGRPWRRFAYTLLKECEINAQIDPAGWHNWNNPDNELTARYLEYGCTGAGADRSARVGWSRELTKEEAAAVTPEAAFFHAEDYWTP